MPKGFFTQTAVLLTDGSTTIGEIKSALNQQRIAVTKESPGQNSVEFGGPSLLIPFRPEVNGYLNVDTVSRRWPDSMGDPKSDPTTFGAWSTGHFGPYAFPGGLARAVQQTWAWRDGDATSEAHRGFVRLRMSYLYGAMPNSPVMPNAYDPLAELMFLGQIVSLLLNLRGVLCYFNPNGEVLLDADSYFAIWNGCVKEQKAPLQLWSNVRLYTLNETLAFMDSVGNSQFDVRDIEAFFPNAEFDANDVAYYVRNVTHYLMGLEREMRSGEEIDGPGESNLSWTMEVLDNGLTAPPRKVLRLYPKSSRSAVLAAVQTVGTS